MPKQNEWIRLRHMLDHAQEALALAQDRTRDELDSDRLLNLALVRLLEVVGEAANRVPRDEQSLHPEIPLSSIIGLRHRLIHGYDTVDNDILWQVIVQDLPSLVAQLESILAQDNAR